MVKSDSRESGPATAVEAPAVTVATIGYEAATLDHLLKALKDAGVTLLVDVRAVANSRRPGFSKTALGRALAEVGIDYRHLRGLGTPADGRAAARAGHHLEMRRIFEEHLRTDVAREELHLLADVIKAPAPTPSPRVCLLCFEADPAHCHRSLVADALRQFFPVEVEHLRPGAPFPTPPPTP